MRQHRESAAYAFRARGVARKRARKIVGFEGLKGCENFDALVQLYTEL
jgi:hypothetical protein